MEPLVNQMETPIRVYVPNSIMVPIVRHVNDLQ